eukprot:12778980-Alexandrium_andersonii.AAC.1
MSVSVSVRVLALCTARMCWARAVHDLADDIQRPGLVEDLLVGQVALVEQLRQGSVDQLRQVGVLRGGGALLHEEDMLPERLGDVAKPLQPGHAQDPARNARLDEVAEVPGEVVVHLAG